MNVELPRHKIRGLLRITVNLGTGFFVSLLIYGAIHDGIHWSFFIYFTNLLKKKLIEKASCFLTLPLVT